MNTPTLHGALQKILDGYRQIHQETARLSADSQPEEFGPAVQRREEWLEAITRECRRLDTELPGWRSDPRSRPQFTEITTLVSRIGALDAQLQQIMAEKMKGISAQLSRAHDHGRASRSYAGHSRL